MWYEGLGNTARDLLAFPTIAMRAASIEITENLLVPFDELSMSTISLE